MIKSLYALLLFGVIAISCATTEHVSEESSEPQETQEQLVSEDRGPDWYNHAVRSFSDSTSFFGAGLAVASDSLAAYEESLNQAKGYLNYSIDSYGEEIRNELLEGANGDQFGSRAFIRSLRNAVKNLELSEDAVEIEVEHIEKEESVHRVYTKVRIGKETAIKMLEAGINNETFSRSLRNGYSR